MLIMASAIAKGREAIKVFYVVTEAPKALLQEEAENLHPGPLT